MNATDAEMKQAEQTVNNILSPKLLKTNFTFSVFFAEDIFFKIISILSP
jgi:hypothetical protein